MRTRIKELRRARKMSQAELADAVGTTRQTITSIEVGKYTASLPLAYKIARFFGLTIEEVFDFGYEEYFYSGNLCLIEWPEKIEGLLPEETLSVRIRITGDDSRTIEIEN